MGTIREYEREDGTITYHAEVRLKGYPPQRESFRTRTLAKKWIQDAESSIRDGRHFRTAEAKKHTVKDLIDRFVTQWLMQFPDKIRITRQTAYLAWWKDRLGHLLLADLTPAILADARDALLAEKTPRGNIRNPSTVNRYIAAFSLTLTIAMKEWGWIDDSPMRKVSKPSEGKGRNRLLSIEEKNRLLQACQSSLNIHLYPIVSLALLTGMRFGEIVNLRWEDIDYIGKTITLEKTKNGERRILPLTPVVEKVFALSRQTDIAAGLVFKPSSPTNRSGLVDIRNAFMKVLKQAEIPDFRFHDLRHAAASYLAMNGATQGELMSILGHKTPTMTRRYVIYSQKHMANLMERMHANLLKDEDNYVTREG
jgi:integrase